MTSRSPGAAAARALPAVLLLAGCAARRAADMPPPPGAVPEVSVSLDCRLTDPESLCRPDDVMSEFVSGAIRQGLDGLGLWSPALAGDVRRRLGGKRLTLSCEAEADSGGSTSLDGADAVIAVADLRDLAKDLKVLSGECAASAEKRAAVEAEEAAGRLAQRAAKLRAVAFHETLHAAELDNRLAWLHRAGPNPRDRVYACTALAFPESGAWAEKKLDGSRWAVTEKTCRSCLGRKSAERFRCDGVQPVPAK